MAEAAVAVLKRSAICKCLARAPLLALPLATFTSIAISPVMADPAPLPRNLFGSVGLIDMPTARLAPDGEFSFSAAYFENNQRYSLNFQALPWLETSFRYSGLQHYNPLYPVYFDRSFAFKARLWDESDVLPTVAIGVNDLIGTGIYSGEYLVTSKQFGAFDASLGAGWGRLSSANSVRNPLGLLSNSFYRRNTEDGLGGDFNFRRYFRGPRVGIFGGIDWRTPIEDLTLLAEYSSDAYATEKSTGSFSPRSQFNFGASYALSTGATLGLYWLYGRSVGGNMSFQIDPTTEPYPEKLARAPMPLPNIRNHVQQQLALATLSDPSQSNRAFRQKIASRNQLVDKLWQKYSVGDIEIRGRTLLLSVEDGTPDAQCLDAAQILQSYDSDINTVLMRSSNHSPMRCASASAPESDFKDGIFLGDEATRSFGATATVLTIDATAPSYNNKQIERRIIAAAKEQSIKIEAVALEESEAIVYYANYHYFAETDALNRLVAILMKEAPPNIEHFRLISIANSVPQQQFDLLRAPLERNYSRENTLQVLAEDSETAVSPAPLNNPILQVGQRNTYPRFYWSVFPQLREEFFDPDNPLGIQLVGGASASLELFPGLSLTGEVDTTLFEDFTKRASDSLLPHVRTDQSLYIEKGRNGIGDLEADYEFRIFPDVYALARAGYLESMFAGAGGEILWRPENQRWALGIDGFEVWQRNYDRLFGLRNYHIFTGHISAYYSSPWYGLNFGAHLGQYLAGDRGLTVEVTRRFATGVEIGAFVTRTNVSASQFGEGSFDKGILIRIPLGWALPIDTQSEFGFDMRSIQRDGGQRLLGDALLYGATQRSSEGEILGQQALVAKSAW